MNYKIEKVDELFCVYRFESKWQAWRIVAAYEKLSEAKNAIKKWRATK